MNFRFETDIQVDTVTAEVHDQTYIFMSAHVYESKIVFFAVLFVLRLILCIFAFDHFHIHVS